MFQFNLTTIQNILIRILDQQDENIINVGIILYHLYKCLIEIDYGDSSLIEYLEKIDSEISNDDYEKDLIQSIYLVNLIHILKSKEDPIYTKSIENLENSIYLHWNRYIENIIK